MRKAEALLGQRQVTLQRTRTQFIKQNVKDAAKERSKSNLNKGQEVDSSDEYDTDLEAQGERTDTPFDRYGSITYTKTCKKLGIDPIGIVKRGLRSQELYVTGRGLSIHETLAVCNALTENLSVRNVTLNENKLGPIGTEYVSCVMYDNDNIKSLCLARNDIGHVGLSAVCDMMLENTALVRLDISESGSRKNTKDDWFSRLCIKYAKIGETGAGNNLEDTDAKLIAAVLKENQNLTNLNLSHNNLGDNAANLLGPAIGINESLRVLDLSWNHIRPTGGVAICEGLRDNVVMTTINFAYNGLSVPGALAMAAALHENDILTDLDLTCNRIFDEGVVAIGKALLINETLSKLKLANNPMTTASAVTLLTVLKKNEYSALEYVNMSSVHVYKEALTLIKEITEIRPTFDFVYGGIVSSDDQWGGDGAPFNNRNPFTILKEFMAAKNLRLVDLFKYMDKDGSGSVSKEEFVHGLEVYEIPLTKSQIDRLVKMLDKDGDGEVDYEELVSGDKEHRRKERAKLQTLMKMKSLNKKKSKDAKALAQAQADTTANRK